MTDNKPKEKKRALLKLPTKALKRAEFERTRYRVVLDKRNIFEDIIKPEFWAHVGKTLRPFDLIEVLFADGSRYVELIVIDADRLWANVKVLNDTDLTEQIKQARVERKKQTDKSKGKGEDAEFLVEWVSPTVRFGVVRTKDGERVKDNFQTREKAEEWLKEYLKRLAQ